MRNLKTGAIQEKNFNASTKFDQANISKKGSSIFLMKQTIPSTSWIWKHMIHMNYLKNKLGYNKYFIVEGTEVYLVFFEGLLLNVSVSEKVELTIVETDPAIKGAPSNQTKDAKTETGLTLRVPQFIEQGEKIVVFSADGKYAGRA